MQERGTSIWLEAPLRKAAAATGLGVWIRDLETNEIQFDEQCMTLFGFVTGDDCRHRSAWLDRTRPDDQHAAQRSLDDAIRTTADQSVSLFQVVRPDRSICWVRDTSAIERDDTGAPRFVVSFLADVTAETELSQQLADKERRLSLAVRSANLGVGVVHLPDLSVNVDQTLQQLYGFPSGVIDLDAVMQAIHPDDREAVATQFREATGSEQAVTIEHRTITPHGTRWLEVVAARAGDDLITVTRDVTELRTLVDDLRRSETRLSAAAKATGLGGWEVDLGNGLIVGDATWHAIYGLEGGSHRYDDYVAAVHPEDVGIITDRVRTLMTGVSDENSFRIIRPSGEVRWIRDSAILVSEDRTGSARIVGFSLDITDTVRMENEMARQEATFKNLADNLPDVIYRFRVRPSIELEYISSAALKQTGWTQAELLTTTSLVFETFHPDDLPAAMQLLNGSMEHSAPLVLRSRHRNGTITWAEHRVTSVRDSAGEVIAVEGVARNITAQKRYEAQIRYHTLHDPVTGLANRDLALEQLEAAIRRIARHGKSLAVLSVDLDRFSYISDVFGYEASDEVLRSTAIRLEQSVRSSDTVARVGTNEFVVILEEVEAGWVADRATEIMGRLSEVFLVEGGEAFCTASIGVAFCDAVSVEPGVLLRDASAAMHRAKASGPGRTEVFDEDHRVGLRRRAAIEADLIRAIDNREFIVHYQPELDLASGRLLGAEALVRWQHPQRGMIPPIEFIPVAEELGLIGPIGDFVLEQACCQAADWGREFDRPLVMRVNLSSHQLGEPGLSAKIETHLRASGLAPRNLCLEITETVLVADNTTTLGRLNELSELGIHLAIDDFGTGYSSLSYLKRLPVNVLKVDQSFVRGLATSTEDRAIVAAIIGMARALSLDVTAEGIETENELGVLMGLGCLRGQGYYFARPMPVDAFSTWVIERSTKTIGG